MVLTFVPLLAVQRGLYDLPRDMNRFREYIRTMTGGTGEIVVPMVAMNPMGKEAARQGFDRLIEMDAERIARATVEETANELGRAGVPDLRVALTCADDMQGGWTHRTLTEAHERADLLAMLKRGWSVVTFWTSETETPDSVRRRVRESTFRSLHQRRHGPPRTLDEWLRQEGRTRRFAGLTDPLSAGGRAGLQRRVAPHRGSSSFGTIYAVMYGDEPARQAGYEALGFRMREGFDLALSEACAEPATPPATLTT